jgi:molecular chaperone DnaK (HSP70)
VWALDLGSCNSALARWDSTLDRPQLVSLPESCRASETEQTLGLRQLVPSVIAILEKPGWSARYLRRLPGAHHCLRGQLAHIGAEALHRPRAISSVKRALAQSPLATLGLARGKPISAREAAFLFVRELLRAAKRATGERIRSLVVTTPVDCYESYRAELASILHRLGVRELRFVDEPVAAAFGYGLTLERPRRVLVVDLGASTLDLALLELEPNTVRSGSARVLAKSGRALGGDAVDAWLFAHFCRKLAFPPPGAENPAMADWHALLLGEARRVKEALFFQPRAEFELMPPEELRQFEARLRGEARSLEIHSRDLLRLLRQRGLFRTLDSAIEQVFSQASSQGLREDDVDDVLLVGGSTLLPKVYQRFERRFGRDRVRAFQPFEAVAHGACAFAAGRVEQHDFIVHDYALLTHDPKTGAPEHTLIIPRGTHFPTPEAAWTRSFVPTCALGEPEHFFKLIVCEIGCGGPDRQFGWDASGKIYRLGGKSNERVVVPLNEASPTLGRLKPPQRPSDRRARLQVSFGIDEQRWLRVTVLDLRTQKRLLRREPVVRLL